MAQHNLFGQEAEKKAAQYFTEKGFTLLEQNYRYGKAEVDLLLHKDDILICVEVKARSTDFFGTPESFISSKKIKLLVGAVDHYLQENNLDWEVRFDVMAYIVKNNQWIEKHIEDAFHAWE